MKNQKTNKSPVGLKSFTVKLKNWRCGSSGGSKVSLGNGRTALRNTEGEMCCLGFACRAAGYKGPLTDIGGPSGLGRVIPGLNRKKGDRIIDTLFSSRAIRINDSRNLTVDSKISKLKRLGEKHNINISFI